MNRITINGNVFESDGPLNIQSINGGIIVNGQTTSLTGLSGRVEIRVLEGTIHNLHADGSVTAQSVANNVDAGGSVSCGHVGGNVDAGGSVSCGTVRGSVDAGGSVSIKR